MYSYVQSNEDNIIMTTTRVRISEEGLCKLLILNFSVMQLELKNSSSACRPVKVRRSGSRGFVGGAGG